MFKSRNEALIPAGIANLFSEDSSLSKKSLSSFKEDLPYSLEVANLDVNPNQQNKALSSRGLARQRIQQDSLDVNFDKVKVLDSNGFNAKENRLPQLNGLGRAANNFVEYD